MFRADVLSQDAARGSRAADPLLGASVLVAEDNDVNLEVAKFHLENLGCRTAPAINGAVALDLARQTAFDYVLMDCQMPVMDGFEALRAIRNLDTALNRQRTPIIAVTAADDLDSRQDCDSAGFDGFLAKPYSADQLKSALLRCRTGNAAASCDVVKAPEATASINAQSIDFATFSSFVNDFGLDSADMLLKPFVALLKETAKRIESARATDDAKAMQALSHKVAGASGTVGAINLSRQARMVEGLCKRGSPIADSDIESLTELVRAAAVDFDRLLQPGGIEDFMKACHS